MRILLIKPKHIGDSLVLTPTIVALKRARPDAEIWVVVRRGCEGILAGCPEIHRILTIAGVEKNERRRGEFWRELGIMLRLLSVKFDYAFELGDGHRARLLTLFCRSKRFYSVAPASPLKFWERQRFDAVGKLKWGLCHRVEKDFLSVSEFFDLPQPIPPLRFGREYTREWPPAAGLKQFCVMQIGKRQAANRWGLKQWEEVGNYLLEHVGEIVIGTGTNPAEVEEATRLRDRLGPRAIATLGQADWSQMAGLLYRARLYVGLDTAAMHLAAACGCPVVALFGCTHERHWRPWLSPHRIVTDSDASTLEGEEDMKTVAGRTMTGISPAKVIAACEDLLATTPG